MRVLSPASLQLVTWESPGWPEKLADAHRGDTDGEASTRLRGSSSSPRLYRALAREQQVGTALIGFSDTSPVIVTLDRRGGEKVNLQYVSANFFGELGIAPVLGRPLTATDDVVGRPLAIVISHRLWQRQFAGRPDLANTALRVNGSLATVVGVAPPGFFGLAVGEWVDLYAPLAAAVTLTRSPDDATPLAERDQYWWVRQMIRLPVTADSRVATTTLTALYQRLVVPEGVSIPPAERPTLVLSSGSHGYEHLSDGGRSPPDSCAFRVSWSPCRSGSAWPSSSPRGCWAERSRRSVCPTSASNATRPSTLRSTPGGPVCARWTSSRMSTGCAEGLPPSRA